MAVTVSANPSSITLSTADPSIAVEFLVLKQSGQYANRCEFSVFVRQGQTNVRIAQMRPMPIVEGVALPFSYTFNKSTLLQYFTSGNTNTLTVRAVAAMMTGSEYTGEDGYTDITVNLAVPPVVTSFTTDSDFTGNSTVLIEGMTEQYFHATATAQEGATISSVTFSLPNSTTISGTLSSGAWSAATANAAHSAGTYTSICTVTDSRGETATATLEYSIQEHAHPTVTYDIYRCDISGDRDMNGGYVSVTVWASSNPNVVGMGQIDIWAYSGTYPNQTNLIGSEEESYMLTNGVREVLPAGGGVDPDTEYTVYLNAYDLGAEHGGSELGFSTEFNIPAVKRIINVANGGTGIAFGKSATPDLTDSAWPVTANGEVNIDGRDVSGSYYSPKVNMYHLNNGNYELAGSAILTAQTTGSEPAGTWGPGRWAFRVQSYDTTNFTALSTYETFYLPYAAFNKASNNTYQIITGKTQFTRTASLTVAGWSSLTQTVSVTGVTSSSVVMVSPDPASHAAYNAAGVYCSAQGTNTLTFRCTTAPTAALTVNILIVGV